MSGVFSKFANKVDKEQLRKEMAEAKENGGGGIKEVPEGTYYVRVEKIEAKETKKFDPMVTIWFEILAGEYKKYKLFFNQVIQVGTKNQGWQMQKAIDFIDSMETGVINQDTADMEIVEDWLEDVMNAIEDQGFEFELEFKKDKKGYDIYTIKEIFQD